MPMQRITLLYKLIAIQGAMDENVPWMVTSPFRRRAPLLKASVWNSPLVHTQKRAEKAPVEAKP